MCNRCPVLSGQAIRTPTFRRFVSQIRANRFFANRFGTKKPIFEALGQIRANRVFSPIRIQIRVIRAQSSLLSIFWKVDSQKKFFFRSENRFARIGPLRSCVIWEINFQIIKMCVCNHCGPLSMLDLCGGVPGEICACQRAQ